MTTPAERAAERINLRCVHVGHIRGGFPVATMDLADAAKIIREEYALVIDGLIKALHAAVEAAEEAKG